MIINYLIFLNQLVYIYQVLAHFWYIRYLFCLTFSYYTMKHKLSVSLSLQTEAEKHVYRDYVDNVHYFSLVSSLLFVT